MNKAVSKLINKYLGDWIENLNSDQLDISLFSGKIVLENLKVKNDIFQLLGIPFELQHGTIGRIKLNIPWGKLRSKPLEIEISEICAFVTPVHPSTWSESSVRENTLKSKFATLDRFDAMQDSEIKEVNAPGFFERWITKIIENVQLTIEKVYIRYEDKITSPFNYALGVVLERLTTETCDQYWNPMYTSDSVMVYKLMKINSFSVFCDYNVEMVLFRSVYADEISQAFTSLASHEFKSMISHNYILMPFSLGTQLTFNKTFSKDFPIIHAQTTSESLHLNVYTRQLVAVLQLVELIKLFTVFCAGVAKLVDERSFAEAEIEEYKEIYRELLNAQAANDAKKVEKVKKSITAIEFSVKIEEIIDARMSVVNVITKQKVINEKIKEIDSLNKEFRGTFSRFKKVLANLSDAEYEERVKVESEIIASAESELDALMKKETSVYAPVKQSSDEEWLKVLIILSIKNISVAVFAEKDLLTLGTLLDLNFVLGMKNSLFLDIHVSSVKVQDCVTNSPYFPDFFSSGKFGAFIQEDPIKVQVSSGEVYICCLGESLVKIFSIFHELLEKQVDISSYKSEIASKYHQYLKEGQTYLKVLIAQSEVVTIDLDINLKAPIIVFPLDPHSSSAFFVIDLGTVICCTHTSQQGYLQYAINLTNFGMYVVWETTDIYDWRNQGIKTTDSRQRSDVKKIDDLFSQTSINAIVSQSPDRNNPRIEVSASVTEVWIEINPMVLRTLSALQINLVKLIPEVLKFGPDSFSTSDTLDFDIKAPEKPAAVPIVIFLSLKSFGIRIFESGSEICELSLVDIKLFIDQSRPSCSILSITVSNMHIHDERTNSRYLKVLANPSHDHAKPQVTVHITINPLQNITDIGILMEDIRITISCSFVELLLSLYRKYSNINLIPNFAFNSRRGTHFVDCTSYMRLSMHFPSVEIWLAQEITSTVAAFTLSPNLVLISNASTRTIYSSFNLPISTTFLWMTDDLEIAVAGFQVKIIDSEGEAPEMDLVLPCRLFYEMHTKQKDTDRLPIMDTGIKLETMEILLSFSTLRFFQGLLDSWKFLPFPVLAPAIFNMKISSNLVKLTLISDEQYRSNIFCVKLFKVLLDYFEDDIVKNGKIQIEILVDYHNAKYSAWEPAVELWPVSVGFGLKPNEVTVDIRSKQPLNVNITYYLVRLLIEVLNSFRLREDPQESSHKELTVKVEYVIENLLDIPLGAWLIIGEKYEKWVILEGKTYSFTEELIKKLQAGVINRIKWTAVMAYMETPVILAFNFTNKDLVLFGEEYQVPIGETSMKVLNCSYEGFQFPCFIHSFSQGNKRILRFQTGVFIADNTSIPRTFKSLPFKFLQKPKASQIVQAAVGDININQTCLYTREGSPQVIAEIQEYELDSDTKLTVLELNPYYSLKNLLAHDISINTDSEVLQIISPGQIAECVFDPTQKYTIKIHTTPELVSTPLPLFEPRDRKLKIKFASVERSSVSVRKTIHQFPDYEGFSLSSRNKIPKTPKLHSWLLEVYSEFLFINRTSENLSLSGLVLPPGEYRYNSSSKTKIQAKLKGISSFWSKDFSINTIGISGMVRINQKASVYPQCYLYGVMVSQAPEYMLSTKVVTFVPRFVLYNFTGIPLHVQQYGVPGARVLSLEVSSTHAPVVYYMDDYDISKAICVCSAQHWSGPFSIETLMDFQVMLQTENSSQENALNVYEREWFMPSSLNGFTRFIRVIVHTDDEATIHISFMDPKDPDFRIVNKCEEDIWVRQVGFEEFRVVPTYQSIQWTWENHLFENKRVELKIGEIMKKYSIEKIKNYKGKELNDCSVSVIIKGITRELWIESPRYKEAKVQREESDSQNIIFTKDGNSEIISNPRFAIQNSMVPMNELVNSMDTKFLQAVSSEIKTSAVVKISEIGITVLDKDHKECFFVNCKKLNAEVKLAVFELTPKKKITTDMVVKLEHFQVDTIDSNTDIYPVILCPVRREKEVSTDSILSTETGNASQKYNFLMLELQHTVISKVRDDGGTELKHKFENLEIALQEMKIHIHEETICKMINLSYIADLFSSTFARSDTIAETLQRGCNIVAFNPESIQPKSYFRFLKLRAVKFTLTIKQSSKHTDIGLFSDSLLFRIARVVAGAFVTISESSFTFKEVYVLDAFQSIPTLTSMLGRQYLKQAIIQFYKVLGSIDLIGNPINLIGKLGTGVYEFFAEPAKGLVGGPKSFAKGLGKGVQSLVSGVVVGSFDSVSKISGTLYDVLKKATGDETSKKASTESIPKDMLIGMGQGLMDVVNGVAYLFIKPYKGAKNDGTKGFFKGVLMGSIGFISSPLKLTLKIGNVISVAISATTLLIIKGKLQKYGRSRFPRYFSPKKILQRYDLDLAGIKALFDGFTRYSKQSIIYYSQCILKQSNLISEDKSIVILLTATDLLYILDGDIYKSVNISGIKHLEVHTIGSLHFLCIATDTKNFSIPSKLYSMLDGVYAIMLSLNSNIIKDKFHQFEVPEYIDLKQLQKPPSSN